MGAALAANMRRNGIEVGWVSTGRSLKTAERAQRAGLVESPSMQALCKSCDLLLSVCPPSAALEVAREVAALGYQGIFLDANAISPTHAGEIGELIRTGGGTFVDGAIVGPPPAPGASTALYLSGDAAGLVVPLFSEEGLQVTVLGPEIGQASALKMCHSAIVKGLLALRVAAFGAAEEMRVRPALEALLAGRADTAAYASSSEDARRVTAKAWRFAGEMEEVAQTFAGLGLPSGFHQAAGVVFRRLADLNPRGDYLPPEQIWQLLRQERSDETGSSR